MDEHRNPLMFHIGVLQFCLEIPYATSLKDKRQVVKSLKDRIRRDYNVSIAEVDDLEAHTVATLVASMIGRDVPYINGAMDKLLNTLHDWRDASLADHQLEIFSPR
jgi:uncharacterized protein YlxP (DUF503 family)